MSLYLQIQHIDHKDYYKNIVDQMVEALSDDLNTSLALSQILGQVKVLNQLMRVKEKDDLEISKNYQTLLCMLDTMGFVYNPKQLSDSEIALYQQWQKEKCKEF